MGVPAVAYFKTLTRPTTIDFQGMPNRLSEQCFSLDELTASLQAYRGGVARTSGKIQSAKH